MPTQHAFAFIHQPLRYDHEFIVSESNQLAWTFLQNPKQWQPIPVILLLGPASSGKSHLASWFSETKHAMFFDGAHLSDAELNHLLMATLPKSLVVDNIEHCPSEQALFHLYNYAVSHKIPLLLTTALTMQELPFHLPDIRSRLTSIPTIHLLPPDDMLLAQLFATLFLARQLRVGSDVIDYLVLRSERSYRAILQTVELLDQQSLIHKRTITLAFVRATLPLLPAQDSNRNCRHRLGKKLD